MQGEEACYLEEVSKINLREDRHRREYITRVKVGMTPGCLKIKKRMDFLEFSVMKIHG